ncbi:MAG: hypothetical protein HQ530_04490 [Parcubacteria group bacterium]|nr:hypothetical protein [Parcubacteria group bacterium]
MWEKPGPKPEEARELESKDGENEPGSPGQESPAEVLARLKAAQVALMSELPKGDKEGEDERSRRIQKKKKKHRQKRAKQHRN